MGRLFWFRTGKLARSGEPTRNRFLPSSERTRGATHRMATLRERRRMAIVRSAYGPQQCAAFKAHRPRAGSGPYLAGCPTHRWPVSCGFTPRPHSSTGGPLPSMPPPSRLADCAACHSVVSRLQRAVPDNDLVRANAQAQLIPLRRTVMMILFAVAIFRAAPIPAFRAPTSSRWHRVQRPSNWLSACPKGARRGCTST